MKELIDYARVNRATINMASAGIGSDVREALGKQGAEVFAGTPAEFRTFLEREIASTAAQLQPE